MVEEVRIYVEGGGDGSHTKAKVRIGFSGFLKDLITIARSKNIKWHIIACGSRGTAKDKFLKAQQDYPDAYNVLLVDSESQVKTAPFRHLADQDGWNLQESHNEQCHLMVQAMESWLIADVEALKKFYGQDFNDRKIPGNRDVETISNNEVGMALKVATRNTSKGKYHKIHHGPKILELLDVQKVRQAASHCDRLFTTLSEKIGAAV